jgi:hypothetical protein
MDVGADDVRRHLHARYRDGYGAGARHSHAARRGACQLRIPASASSKTWPADQSRDLKAHRERNPGRRLPSRRSSAMYLGTAARYHLVRVGLGLMATIEAPDDQPHAGGSSIPERHAWAAVAFHRLCLPRLRGTVSVPGRWPVGRSTGAGASATASGSSLARIALIGSSRRANGKGSYSSHAAATPRARGAFRRSGRASFCFPDRYPIPGFLRSAAPIILVSL